MMLTTIAFITVLTMGAAELDLVDIPAGTGRFGDPSGDANEVVRRAPVAAFRLMRREVTNGQFAAFVRVSGYRTTVEKVGEGYVWTTRWRAVSGADWRHPQGSDSSIGELGDHPVVQVSARDAEAFCRHYGLRLPTEEEWAFAARGPAGLKYVWGNTLTRADWHHIGNVGTWDCCAASDDDGYSRTAPVGRFPAGRSVFGIDDLAGNVWEWTASRFPGQPGHRVIRGGGWGNNPYCLRTAYRHGNPPEIGLDMVGFRCAGDG